MPDLAGKIDSRWTVSTDGTVTPIQVAEGNDTRATGRRLPH